MLKLIDVSEHEGKIHWELVKPQIDGAILRCGYGMDLERQDDGQFRRNAAECVRLGIPFGVYLYSYADTNEKARSEAAHVLRLVKEYPLSYPVYLDLEEKGTQAGAIERANIFGDIIEAAGYWCGVYANLYWWNTYLKGLDRFTKWVAQYNKTCDFKGSHLDIWQYTDEGKLEGINGNVDMNICYRDLVEEIKKYRPQPEKSSYSLEQFVREVQAALGAEAEDIFDKTVTLAAWCNPDHPAVVPVQKWLHTLGYSQVGMADGVAGPKFTAAVKAFQQANGCVADGEITAKNKTWRKLLGME